MKRLFFVLFSASVLFSPLATKAFSKTQSHQISSAKTAFNNALRESSIIKIKQPQQNLIGEVTAIDSASGRITLKSESGTVVTISINDKTAFRRIAPGQTSIANAEQITIVEIRVGDRILIPGGSTNEQTPVRQIVVMARQAIDSQRNQEAENRRARTIIGRVTAINSQNREISIQTRGTAGPQTMTVTTSDTVKFLRYAPDSLRISDALPGAFADVRVGDQIRIVGDRNAENTRITAEEIVSGSFTRSVGSIVEVNAARNEITIKNSENGQTMTVALGKNTTLRRIPDDVAENLRRRANQRAERQRNNRQNAGNNEARQNQGQQNNRQNRRENRENNRNARQGQPNRAQLFESLPVITAAELKKGDAVLITTSGANNSRLTAVSIITGDASLQQLLLGVNNMSPNSPGLPGNVGGGNTIVDDEPRNQ
jgi:hypothetical protein